MFLPILLSAQDIGGDYYVAVDGDDSGPGSYERPFATWQKAFETAQAGETVYFRGGVWYPQDHSRGSTICEIHVGDGIGHAGTREKPIRFFAYPGEKPVLDCSQVDMTGNRFNGALDFYETSWIHVKGLTIRNVPQPESGELASGVGAGMCSYMTFENLTVHNVGGRGMSYWGVAGHPDIPEIPTDTTRFINCDIYDCVDLLSEVPGNGSDAVKMDAEEGTYLYFYGCRAWNCGDDGFDISGPGLTIFEKCWSFGHKLEDALDGNGFKFGANRGSGAVQTADGNTLIGPNIPGVRKIVKNCISANNAGFGFYELAYSPYYPNRALVYNNFSYANGIGIEINVNPAFEGITPSTYYNNIIYKTVQDDAGGRPYNLSSVNTYTESNNTWDFAGPEIIGSLPWWQPTDSVIVTDDDFVSLDLSQLELPRKEDGSLPDITFGKLNTGSDLIDAGIDVGTPYYGDSPDIGYAEYIPNNYNPLKITQYSPEKTLDMVSVSYYSPITGSVSVIVLNETGNQLLSSSSNATEGYNNKVNIDLSTYESGIYTVKLNDGSSSVSVKVTKIPADIDVDYKIVKKFPNPTTDLFAIQFTCPEPATLSVTVSDELGEVVMSDYYPAQQNLNKMVLNLSPLEKGNYKITLNKDNNILSTKVTKQ